MLTGILSTGGGWSGISGSVLQVEAKALATKALAEDAFARRNHLFVVILPARIAASG